MRELLILLCIALLAVIAYAPRQALQIGLVLAWLATGAIALYWAAMGAWAFFTQP